MGFPWVFHGFSLEFPHGATVVGFPHGAIGSWRSFCLRHPSPRSRCKPTRPHFFFRDDSGDDQHQKKRRKTYENTTDIVINNGTFKLHLLGFEDEIWRKIPIDAVDYDHPHGTPHRDLASTWWSTECSQAQFTTNKPSPCWLNTGFGPKTWCNGNCY